MGLGAKIQGFQGISERWGLYSALVRHQLENHTQLSGHGPVREGTEEAMEMLQGLEPLCCAQPGEEEVPGRPQSLFQGLKEVFRKEEK